MAAHSHVRQGGDKQNTDLVHYRHTDNEQHRRERIHSEKTAHQTPEIQKIYHVQDGRSHSKHRAEQTSHSERVGIRSTNTLGLPLVPALRGHNNQDLRARQDTHTK